MPQGWPGVVTVGLRVHGACHECGLRILRVPCGCARLPQRCRRTLRQGVENKLGAVLRLSRLAPLVPERYSGGPPRVT